MILVDTSVWIDHLHTADTDLVAILEAGLVVQHPMVVGELALGSLHERARFLSLLSALPRTPLATHHEVMTLVERESLYGRGLSLVDAHLVASLRLLPEGVLWTRDACLRDAAKESGVLTCR